MRQPDWWLEPMNARILVVEDDATLLSILESSVGLGGYDSVGVQSGRQALGMLKTQAFDAMLLDLGLPDIEGEDVLRAVRAASDVPVIVVSGRNSERDKIRALDLGADDYLPKPFLPGELLARLRATLRRYAPGEPSMNPSGEGDEPAKRDRLLLDPRSRKAILNGKSALFSETEFKILDALVDARGAPVSKETFLRTLYGEGEVRATKVVEVVLGRVRRKLKVLTGGTDLIDSRRGLGWTIRTHS